MINTIHWSFLVVVQVLALTFASNAHSQVDPEQGLIGTWQGHAETTKNQERTLVINSVKATGNGEWVGRGRFGQGVDTEKAGGNMEITISSKNNEIYLEWTGNNGKAPVHVKLVGDNKLEGTIEAFERNRVAERRITFEKVKAGDVK